MHISKSLWAAFLLLGVLPFTTASMCQSIDTSDVVGPKLGDGSPITVVGAGPDGGDCSYKVWGQVHRTQSVFSPTTTDARMMAACTDEKGKTAEHPVAIAGTDAQERSGFKQVADPFTHLGAATLLGPVSALLMPDPSDNIEGDHISLDARQRAQVQQQQRQNLTTKPHRPGGQGGGGQYQHQE